MSVAYFRCLASLPLEDVERKQVGAHIYRATSDISAVQNLVMSVFSGVASHLVPLIVAVGIMLTLDWRIGLAFLACVPIPPLLRVWISLRLKPLERDTRDLNEHIGGFLGRSLSAIKVMKAFGSETSQSLKYLRLMREAVRLNFRVWAATTLLSRIEWFFSSGLGMLFQWCILFMLMKDHTTLGSAVALSWYFSLIVGPFMGFATIVQNVIAGSVAGERVLEVLEGPKERVYEGPRVPRPRSGSAIRMRDVRFAYSGGQDVLRNVTLDVPPGSVTALVGANGSGKTTIVNLICGFHTGYEGAISVNGLEVSDASLASLRKMIALVPQEATLLGDTVLDSIVCARPDAGMDDVVRAAKMARIHDRIMAMPTGYHTRLAGAGVELSAGERQKLVISRAFLREAPILILDEPFANLDAESEHKVLESVIGHEPGRTTLMITHHLSNIVLADHVVFIESGSVAASGLPRDVMKTLDDGASIVGA